LSRRPKEEGERNRGDEIENKGVAFQCDLVKVLMPAVAGSGGRRSAN
jgi:hypothetical protein